MFPKLKNIYIQDFIKLYYALTQSDTKKQTLEHAISPKIDFSPDYL